MAGHKVQVLLAALLVLLGGAAALKFHVNVDEELETAEYQLQYQNSTADLQEINVTIENIGSIGCSYRLKGLFDNGEKVTRYSRSYPVWSGLSQLAELHYAPLGYNGTVNASIYLEYCGTEKFLRNITFEVTDTTRANRSFESRTLETNFTASEIKMRGVKEGLLVPVDYPAYWKTGSAEIDSGKAVVEYEAPIFRAGKKIKYAVLNETTRDVLGTTKVKLEARPTLLEKIRDRFEFILALLLAASVAFNAYLIQGRYAIEN
ncbi:MAG: hypothetical protein ABEI58_04190 [Candidatus Nanohaloarchaea archaeon]